MKQVTDESTAGGSLKGKMVLGAKHMGLLENMRTAKDKLFQMAVQGGDKQITQPSPKTFANWNTTAQTQKWKTIKNGITWSLFIVGC